MKFTHADRQHLLSNLKSLLLVCIAYYLITWFTGCPIKYYLGISCPGCGMTRAWMAVLHLDFAGAFSFHPLFWTAPFLALAILFEYKIDFKKYHWALVLTAALFIIVYIIRLIWIPNDIVVWEPEKGVIYQTISRILHLEG
ncbi:MAG: DUF2752 domain-containing protein [Oliverpabstia sp.]